MSKIEEIIALGSIAFSPPKTHGVMLDFNNENPWYYIEDIVDLVSPGSWRRARKDAKENIEYHDRIMGKEKADAFRKEVKRNNSFF